MKRAQMYLLRECLLPPTKRDIKTTERTFADFIRFWRKKDTYDNAILVQPTVVAFINPITKLSLKSILTLSLVLNIILYLNNSLIN